MRILFIKRFHFRFVSIVFFCFAINLGIFPGQANAREPIGLANLEHFERLPYFKNGVKSGLVSAHGRAGYDDYIEGYAKKKYVLLDVKGPGCIYRFFSTDKSTHANIAYFVDDQPSPVINKEYYAFTNYQTFPFVVPLVGNYKQSCGGYYNYLPIPFKKSCRIVAMGIVPMFFYNISYHLYDNDEGIKTFNTDFDHEETERLYRVRKMWQSAGSPPTKNASEKIIANSLRLIPGQTGRLLQIAGAGAITALKIDISPPQKAILNNCRLKIFWDGESNPSVDVPLGPFFGSGLGEIDFKSLPLGMSTSGWYYCYFPMPYWKSAKIIVTNDSGLKIDELKYEIHHTLQPYARNKAGYFKAYYNKEHPTKHGKPYTILNTQGRGQLVGTVTTIGGRGPRILEGGERVYVDGSSFPQLWGSGTEAFLGGAWYFGRGFFSLPSNGFTARATEKQPNGKLINYLNGYRFYLGDCIPFCSSINMVLAHGNNSRTQGFYSSVAYYYAIDTPNLILTDELDVGKRSSESQHKYFTEEYKNLGIVNASYEDKNRTRFIKDEGLMVNKYSQFQVNIIPDNQGVRLRRRTFYKKASQETKVSVDGVLVGNWYIPENQIQPMWLDTEFEIPAKYTKGKESLTVKIEPANPKQSWNEFYYWIYTYK